MVFAELFRAIFAEDETTTSEATKRTTTGVTSTQQRRRRSATDKRRNSNSGKQKIIHNQQQQQQQSLQHSLVKKATSLYAKLQISILFSLFGALSFLSYISKLYELLCLYFCIIMSTTYGNRKKKTIWHDDNDANNTTTTTTTTTTRAMVAAGKRHADGTTTTTSAAAAVNVGGNYVYQRRRSSALLHSTSPPSTPAQRPPRAPHGEEDWGWPDENVNTTNDIKGSSHTNAMMRVDAVADNALVKASNDPRSGAQRNNVAEIDSVVENVISSSWNALTTITRSISKTSTKIDGAIEDGVRRVVEYAENLVSTGGGDDQHDTATASALVDAGAGFGSVIEETSQRSDSTIGTTSTISAIRRTKSRRRQKLVVKTLSPLGARGRGGSHFAMDTDATTTEAETADPCPSASVNRLQHSVIKNKLDMRSEEVKRLKCEVAMLRTRLRQQRLQNENGKEPTADATATAGSDDTNQGEHEGEERDNTDTSARSSGRTEARAPAETDAQPAPDAASGEGDELTMQLTMQLSSLLKQKSELSSDNDRLARENDQLHELLDYMMNANGPDCGRVPGEMGLPSQDSFLLMEREDEYVFESPEKRDAPASPQRTGAYTR